MGRRPKHLHPQPKLHARSRHARVRISGETFWLGRFGSNEAAAEYDRLIGEWLSTDRQRPPSRRPRAAIQAKAPSDPQPQTPLPQKHGVADQTSDADRQADSPCFPEQELGLSRGDAEPAPEQSVAVTNDSKTFADGLTVGELCNRWIDWIERNRCPEGRDKTSLYYSARQATKALEDFWDYPAHVFGSRNLLQVQAKLVHTPVVSRPLDPKKPKKARPRSRTTVNDTINRIRQMFKWGALYELVPDDRVPVLQLVPPLLSGQTAAPDASKEKAVSDTLVDATLPHLPPVIADLIRFARLVGCRPGEARKLRPCDIDRRPLAEYKGVWVWRVTKYKNSWRKKHLPRAIAVGPKAQALLSPWLERLRDRPDSHVFSPKFSERRLTLSRGKDCCEGDDSTIAIPVTKRLVNDFYSKDSLNKCIARGCLRGRLQKWNAGQLRHTRLTEVRETHSLDVAQAVGGHSNVNTTELYATIALSKAIEAAKTG